MLFLFVYPVIAILGITILSYIFRRDSDFSAGIVVLLSMIISLGLMGIPLTFLCNQPKSYFDERYQQTEYNIQVIKTFGVHSLADYDILKKTMRYIDEINHDIRLNKEGITHAWDGITYSRKVASHKELSLEDYFISFEVSNH